MAEWHYSRGNEQHGPVSSAQLKQMAAGGQLQPTDLIWKDGMPGWVAAGKIKGLFDAAVSSAPAQVTQPAAASRAAAAPPRQAVLPQPAGQPASPIEYYNPTGGVHARVAKTMKGFPRATGLQSDWPLTDVHLAQLKEAERQRKAIRGFNSLCQLFVLIYALAALGLLIGVLAAATGPGAARMFRGESLAFLGGALAATLAMGTLYYLAGKAALKCRVWGPITVLVLLAVGIVWTMVSFFFTASASRSSDASAMIIFLVAVVGLGGAFIYVCVRGLMAISKFLACPLWAQEALVNAKL
jgi:GYF domain 2